MNKTVFYSLLFGVIFGACFPLGAWVFDLIISGHHFSLQNISVIHSNNLLHWIIDLAPFVLGLMGFIIGLHRQRLKVYAEGLEQKVKDRTQELLAKQIEMEGQETELNEFLNSAPVMMWMSYAKGNVTKFNHAVSLFRGEYLDPEQSEKSEGAGVHTDDLQSYKQVYQGSIARHMPLEHEFRWQNNKGEYRWISEIGFPRFDANNAYIGHTGVCLDITEKKQSELAIQLLNKELKVEKDNAEQASRSKSEFLANMSHEIRTPMNGVLGMAELLLSSQLTSKQYHFTETIQRSGQALLIIINDILDLSKIEAGKLDLDLIDFDLRENVEDCINMFVEQAESKKLELICDIPDSIPVQLRGDPSRLRQIVVNLVGNALKFTETGEVVLRISLLNVADGKVNLHFTITDTGIGIKKETQATIFDSFSQADGSTTRRFGGTGLGLTISSQLVSLMNGKIGVKSEPGKGSTFWFTVQFLESISVKGNNKFQNNDNWSEINTLIVDDNDTNREVLSNQLSSWNLSVDIAESGQQALALLHKAAQQKNPYQLAILDYHMPEMDGLELARAIKNDAKIADIKLVMLSSINDQDTDAWKRHGILSYVTKPVRQVNLYSMLNATIGQDSTEANKDRIVEKNKLPIDILFNANILIVEDSQVNQLVANEMLMSLGCQTETVTDGKGAIAAVDKKRFDLIFMDCQMPIMDGYQATRIIRGKEQNQNNKNLIIALTANAMDGDRKACLDAEMDDYLSKPFNKDQLIDILLRWLPEHCQVKSTERKIDKDSGQNLIYE